MQKPHWIDWKVPAPWEGNQGRRSNVMDWQAEQEALVSAIRQRIADRGCGGTTMEDLETLLLSKHSKKSLRIAVFQNFDTLSHERTLYIGNPIN